MTLVNLALDLSFNSRVIQGLRKLDPDEQLVFDVYSDHLKCDITVDLGRWDAEGDKYILELLDILPGDLIQANHATPNS